VNPETIRQTTVHFAGHVQGVGFRYTVLQVAKGYDVTGFVKNLTDGRVQLVAEGEGTEVDQFIAAVTERMAGYIRGVERVDSSGARQYQSFALQ